MGAPSKSGLAIGQFRKPQNNRGNDGLSLPGVLTRSPRIKTLIILAIAL